MIMSDVMTRLEAVTVPDPLRGVFGSLDFAALEGAPNAPCAFVIPIAEDARANTNATMALDQEVTDRFGVVLALRNRNDKTGASAESQLTDLRNAVRDALLNWKPSVDYDPVEYRRGRLIDMRRGIVWWQDEFVTRTHLRV